MKTRDTYTLLGLAGTLPFAAGAALALADIQIVPGLGPVAAMVTSYGLAIASFLTGTHWAMQIIAKPRFPGNLLVISNFLFLVAWFSYLLLPAAASALILAGVFAILLLIDSRLFATGTIDQAYFRMRLFASGVAIVSLLVITVT